MPKGLDELSRLEQWILLALVRLHPNGYGVSVQDEIRTRAETLVSFGSIYASLDRLEERGFVREREGEPYPERGGRRKIYYTLTAPGHRALDRSLSAIDALRTEPFKGVLA